nr:MAG TPA: hypothetical protein [Caudoviricetes sp.]
MPYNKNTGIISAPVSIDDVKQALGESSNDLATLCKSKNILLWAKYKPYHINQLFIDDNDWYNINGDHGITIPNTTSLNSVIEFYNQNNNGFGYYRPVGGENSPYRLGDFRGYDSNAKFQIKGISHPTTWVKGDGYITFGCSIYSDNELGNSIKLSDFETLKNCYFGVMLLQDKTIKYYRTSNKTILNDGISINISDSAIYSGTYDIYPFLSTASFYNNQNANNVASIYYPIPNCNKSNIFIKSESSESYNYRIVSAINRNNTITVGIHTRGNVPTRQAYIALKRDNNHNLNSIEADGEEIGVKVSGFATNTTTYFTFKNKSTKLHWTVYFYYTNSEIISSMFVY